jgi:hypothetical protein
MWRARDDGRWVPGGALAATGPRSPRNLPFLALEGNGRCGVESGSHALEIFCSVLLRLFEGCTTKGGRKGGIPTAPLAFDQRTQTPNPSRIAPLPHLALASTHLAPPVGKRRRRRPPSSNEARVRGEEQGKGDEEEEGCQEGQEGEGRGCGHGGWSRHGEQPCRHACRCKLMQAGAGRYEGDAWPVLDHGSFPGAAHAGQVALYLAPHAHLASRPCPKRR